MAENLSLLTVLGPQPVSSISHLVAAGAALIAAVPLIRLGKSHPERRLALTVYATCVVLTLAISGTYHAFSSGATRMVMQRIDHSAIWCLIAGTFTAIHGVMWKGFWRRGLLSFVWGYALLGIVLQIVWFRAVNGNVGLALYLVLGWVGMLSIVKLGRQIGWTTVLPIFYAGLAYSGGAVFEACHLRVLIASCIGSHEIFHFAVIAGVTLHWLFIRKLILHHAPRHTAAEVLALSEAVPLVVVASPARRA